MYRQVVSLIQEASYRTRIDTVCQSKEVNLESLNVLNTRDKNLSCSAITVDIIEILTQ